MSDTDARIERLPLLDAILSRLRDMIIEGQLPPGTRLNEGQIATIIRKDGFRLWGNRSAGEATDTQWAFWDGVKNYYKKNEAYLQGQIGNPEGDDKPNKKYYDPRAWLRKGEESFKARLVQAFKDLNNIGTLA